MNRIVETPSHRIDGSIDSPIDQGLDRALAVLRDAQPRAGFDGRLLHALEARDAATPRTGLVARLPNLIPSFPFTAWAAAGALVLAALAMLLPHRAHRSPSRSVARVVTPGSINALSFRPQPPLNPSSRPEVRSAEAERPAFEIIVSRVPPLRAQPYRALRWTDPSALSQQHLTPEQAADLADLRAPSRPAPSLPLTPQEKALVQMLRHSNAVELASLSDLNPTVRAARDADEAAAFHAFFPDPPPIPQPDGDTE